MRMESGDYQHDCARPAGVGAIIHFLKRVSGGLAIVAVVALTGCSSSIAVTSPSETRPLTAATVEPSEHQLGIVAVDFDPPLDYAQIASSGGVNLMVVVENRGSSDETGIRVTARLVDPGAEPEVAELTNETVVLRELAAGQIRVVRFPQVSAFPLLDQYRLDVVLDPAPGESETGDNYRSYDIVISDEN